MKTLMIPAALAMALGAAVASPASAQVTIQGPQFGHSDSRDCRTIEKRVVKNGRTTITRERRCDGNRGARRHGDDRHVDRRDARPGIYIGR
ncbi:hypothetical protein [Hansschlegelia sp. KR7-227]|jgi:hypothetical protein|uniref:hypothetical protein n=1 Tax=Hansschlegelia sp. KR7-227 TaxID=3400914 RepID=UPI003BFF5586